MTGIQRVRNKCMFFLQLEERAKADRDPAKAKHARSMYRTYKFQLNSMKARREQLASNYLQHDLHKHGASFQQYVELVELSLKGLEAPYVSSTQVQGGGYSSSEQIV
jgi:hypothetical protein